MRIIKFVPGGWWGIVFPATAVLLALLLAVSTDVSPSAAAVGYAFLAVLAVGSLILGSRAFRPGPASFVFLAIVIVAVAVLCAIQPTMAIIQAVAYPYAWEWTRSHTRKFAATAWVVNALVAAAVVIGFTIRAVAETSPAIFWSGLTSGVVSLAFSMTMGTWISSIADASLAKGRLQAQLDSVSKELAEAHRRAGAAGERERFAHEIHDTLTQTLTAVVMLTERAKEEVATNPEAAVTSVAFAERTARQALAETRSLIAEGRGLEVGADGLADRISRLCTRFAEETDLRVGTEISGELDAIDRPDQVVLLRCLQEALANVRKHAQAAAVLVEVTTVDGITLAITDDGIGFPDEVSAATERGYGLAGIASRLALSNGTLKITSGDDGTRLSIHLPAAQAVPVAQLPLGGLPQ